MKKSPRAPPGSAGDVNMLWSEISAGRMTASEAMELLRQHYDVATEKPEPTNH